jgi:hypothetical protein
MHHSPPLSATNRAGYGSGTSKHPCVVRQVRGEGHAIDTLRDL